MTLNQRRLLYISFIVLFFLLTPAISFYAAGYNFDWKTGDIQRTAILIVETMPRGATITLEAQASREHNWLYEIVYNDITLQTPEKVRNLLPGDYRIRLEKEGYLPYERRLHLEGGTTTVLNDIPLFRAPAPQPVVVGDIKAAALAPDERQLATVVDNSLRVVDTNNGRQVTGSLADSIAGTNDVSLAWSADSGRVLVSANGFDVYAAASGERLFSVAQLLPQAPQLAAWDAGDGAVLYALAGATIYRINSDDQTAEPVWSGLSGVAAIAGQNDILYAVTTGANESVLRMYQMANATPLKAVFLPHGSEYRLQLHGDTAYVHETRRRVLYLVKPGMFLPLDATLAGVEDFSVAGDTVTYWNRFELWRYHAHAGDKVLIARLSSPVHQGLPYIDNRYLLYSTDAALNIAELKDGHYRASFPLLDWQGVSQLFVNRAGTDMYLVSPHGETKALYHAKLR